MTKVALAPFPVFYDNDGNPLSGGKVFTYDAGTLVNRATYTDRDGGTPNANPVILDSAGRADIWLDANVPYKIVVKNADESLVVADVDDFYGGADPAQLTLAGIVPATGGTYTGPVVFEGGVTFAGDAAENLASLDSLGIAPVQNANLWINSDLAIWQRNTAAVADGAYGFDRVVNLCESGNTTLSLLQQPADGIPYAMRSLQPDAVAKRIGSLQIVEARNCLAYRGKQLVFAPKVRCSAGVTVRVALVAWVGAVDAPTRDAVNNWASTNYTAGNFFVASTLPIAVGAVALTANTWADVPVSSASPGGVVVPSTLTNLYMMVWTDTALAQNATLDLSVVRCGPGTAIPLWTPPNAQQELAKCQRYYETGLSSLTLYAAATVNLATRIKFSATKRVTPSVTTSGVAEANCSGSGVASPSVDSVAHAFTVTATGPASSTFNYAATAEV
jgi:hypothetical protein